MYAVRDTSHGVEKQICETCLRSRPRCFVCNMPLAGEHGKFKDGRLICQQDLAEAIFSNEDAQKVLEATQTELKRIFWEVLKFPETNVTFELVDRPDLNAAASMAPNFNGLQGLTVSRITTNLTIRGSVTNFHNTYNHRILTMFGMPRARLIAICAHEMTHTWLHEHLSANRKIEQDTIEAFCELVSHRVMQSINQPYEQEVIEANLYSRGQINVLLETDKRYPFTKIVEWMQHGTESRLTDENLHQILAIQTNTEGNSANGVPFKIVYSNRLQLKGITGGNRKLALINNKTLEQGERGNVIVGETNILVKVESIEAGSVTVVLPDGSKEILKLNR
ncbi:MAG: zinc-binding protein [Verrucomicrobiales bacterium]|nr:zinc-binding protein [Verrucomicrobiales bacterium]